MTIARTLRTAAASSITALALAFTASAAPVTYDFTVTALNGPLIGVSSTGHFSFDDAIIPAGGGQVTGTLLTDLDLTWNGVTYDESNANTWYQGSLSFDAAGFVVGGLFGTATCGAICADGSLNSFYVLNGSFTYGHPATSSIYIGTASWSLRVNDVPEPASAALVLAALGLMASLQRRRSVGAGAAVH